MKKKILCLCCAFLMLANGIILAGCSGKGDTQETVSSAGTGLTTVSADANEVIRYRISEKEDYYIPLYDWYRKQQRSSDGRGSIYWNNQIAKKLSCNWINVFPSGKYKTRDVTAPGAFLLDIDRIIEYTAKGVEDSHKQGIKVMTSAPIAEIFDDTWLDWGIDPTEMKTMNEEGKYIGPDKNGLSHACNNDPQWQQYMISYTEKIAKAGYDGCLYDGYTYAYDPGYYCQCSDCKAGWKQFCIDNLGREEPLPKSPRRTGMDAADNEITRLFMVWRLKTQSDFYNALLAAGRKYVPGFEVYINSTIYDIALTYFYLNGLDVTSSEFKHKLGHESSVFMYAIQEALSDKQLISFTNVFTSQYSSIKEYYVELASAYAAGGAMCAAEVSRTKDMEFYVTDVTKKLGEILTSDQPAFRSTGNIAETAILYSWRDESYFHIGGFNEFRSIGGTNVRELYDNCPARRNAVNLAKSGIPFAYLIAEKNPAAEELSRYGTVILPELTLVDKSLEDALLTYVQNGGTVIVEGKTFASKFSEDANGVRLGDRDYDVLEKWTGTSFENAGSYAVYPVGKGKVIVCRNYCTNEEVEMVSRISDTMAAALTEAGVIDQVKIDKAPETGYVETTLRANATGTKMYLHLITSDVTENYQPENYTASVVIPEGATVTDVTVTSPFDNDIGFRWEVKDGRVVVSGSFNIYSYVTVALSYKD